MKITFHGHACISIQLENQETLIFDPFITGNPVTDLHVNEVKANWILVTHGHNDHIGDMVEIGKNNDATVISMVEIADYAAAKGVKSHGMNIGGKYDFPFGTVHLVYAQHSSSYQTEQATLYMGVASGMILQIAGKTIYHAGDTAEFSDMTLIGKYFDIDLAFLPIGDNFTMGPEAAARAAKRISAKKVVPIHYDTFPVIKQNPDTFISLLPEDMGKIMHVGETIEL